MSEAAKVSVPLAIRVNVSNVLLIVPEINTGLLMLSSGLGVLGEQPKNSSLLQEDVPRFRRLSLAAPFSILKFSWLLSSIVQSKEILAP